MFDAIIGDSIPKSRRAKRLVCFKLFHGVDDIGWINVGWPCGIHLGENRGCSHGDVEQSKERESRDVSFAGLQSKVICDLLTLFDENSMTIENTLGRPGAAGRENDGGRIIAF